LQQIGQIRTIIARFFASKAGRVAVYVGRVLFLYAAWMTGKRNNGQHMHLYLTENRIKTEQAYLQSLHGGTSEFQLVLVSAEVDGLGLLQVLGGVGLRVFGNHFAINGKIRMHIIGYINRTEISLALPRRMFTRLFMSAFSILERNFSLHKNTARWDRVTDKNSFKILVDTKLPVELVDVCQSHLLKCEE
jgi:hypothetical protein